MSNIDRVPSSPSPLLPGSCQTYWSMFLFKDQSLSLSHAQIRRVFPLLFIWGSSPGGGINYVWHRHMHQALDRAVTTCLDFWPNYKDKHFFWLHSLRLRLSFGWSPSSVVLGCVRLGNPDLDFENLNPHFPVEREIRKRISPPKNPSSGWISIKKCKSGYHGFPFYRSIGKSEKGFAKLFSWTVVLFSLSMRARARLLFLRTVFQILFRISQSNGKNKNP